MYGKADTGGGHYKRRFRPPVGESREAGLLKWIPRERVFVSGDLGAAKPEPEIFRIIEKRLGLQPEEIWFAGDSYANDVTGAKRAGWKSLWLNRRDMSSLRAVLCRICR